MNTLLIRSIATKLLFRGVYVLGGATSCDGGYTCQDLANCTYPSTEPFDASLSTHGDEPGALTSRDNADAGSSNGATSRVEHVTTDADVDASTTQLMARESGADTRSDTLDDAERTETTDFDHISSAATATSTLRDGSSADTADDSSTRVVQISAGAHHTCAVLSDGAVRCWGDSYHAQLGYANTVGIGDTPKVGDDETPASAGNVDVGGPVLSIAAGRDHTCALLEGGRVRCWGKGELGQLGYGDTYSVGHDEPPASAGDVDVGGLVVSLTAGDSHTCALLEGGRVRCWGYAGLGQLGYGNKEDIGDDETPASAGDVDVGGTVVSLTAGPTFTCAVLDTRALRCWGYGSGQFGYVEEIVGDDETPTSVPEAGSNVESVAARGEHACFVLTSGRVRCLGKGALGQLGYGNTNNVGESGETLDTTPNVDVGGLVLTVAVGDSHTCAVMQTGAVRCWGGGGGLLGYGNTDRVGDDGTPANAGNVDVGAPVSALTLGGSHTCALTDDGRVVCWGLGFEGQLGYGNIATIGDDETPQTAGYVVITDEQWSGSL